MDIEALTADLNDAQRRAVTLPPGRSLVLAGAGSGKTRVLTRRAAYLVRAEGASPFAILAVTFTNKAAAEMRERLGELLGIATAGMWVGTFHGIAHRLLRQHAERAGLPEGFQILDADDQLRQVRRVLRARGADESRFPPRQVRAFIAGRKEEGERPDDVAGAGNPYHAELLALYRDYEAACRRGGLVDFAELLLRAYELLRDDAELLGHYRQRFGHILVDEFQDTNALQYRWLKQLAGAEAELFVVGDDDQCVTADTPIAMADGTHRPVQEVQAGDWVLSNHGAGSLRPAQVLRAHTRTVSRPLIRITTESGRHLTTTAEHTHFADIIHSASPQRYYTYLMEKRGVGFRLGTSQIYTANQKTPVVGYQQRCLQEGADAVWLLDAFDNEVDARELEHRLSLHYGITTLPFVARTGQSENGLVHDQARLDRLHADLAATERGHALLTTYGLHPETPHHVPQSSRGRRRNLYITLNAEVRGATPSHRIALSGNDTEGRDAVQALGLKPRVYKRNPQNWRYEALFRDFSQIESLYAKLAEHFELTLVYRARLLANRRALAMRRASELRPGMVVVNDHGEAEAVTAVEQLPADGGEVYDLDIAGTHNFIAGGIVTHNSIYGWRGARVENLEHFRREMGDVQLVRLERNYRSTSTILEAANALIEHNDGRLGKRLWTEGAPGEPIAVYAGFNEVDEARWVAGRIRALLDEGHGYGDFAVLYRSNAQSRALEEALLAERLPYRVYGGLRFFERAEVKDALAYLRLIANRHDDASFERVVNTPARGVGAKTAEAVRGAAREAGVSLWRAARQIIAAGALAGRARNALQGFLDTVDALEAELAGEALHRQVEGAIARAGLRRHHERDEARLENLDELVTAARTFAQGAEQEAPAGGTLTAFLTHAALEAGEGQAAEGERSVQLMTLHAAKGLEFPVVFLAGLEEGLFPHHKSVAEEGRLEEERRLCYVGMTRARQRLLLSYAEKRRLHGVEQTGRPSRFLGELPAELLEEVRPAVRVGPRAAPEPAPQRDDAPPEGLALGQRVRHARFGEGVILACEGRGSGARLQVRFDEAGTKWLVAGYAALEPL